MNQSAATSGPRLSVAEIATPNASRYLQQLCKHFAHRLPAGYDAHAGRVTFPLGDCDLAAGNGVLQLSLAAPDAAGIEKLQDVVASHLLRFAFRETLQVDWRAA